MKLLIIGYARHGKDTAPEYFRDFFGMSFLSSSQAALDLFLFDQLKEKYGYETKAEAFADRVNHRTEWKEAICAYNTPDKARLAREILHTFGVDAYVGMRDSEEIEACTAAKLFNIVIWIDASDRLPPEPYESCPIDKSSAHFIIENNGDKEDFYVKLKAVGEILFKKSL